MTDNDKKIVDRLLGSDLSKPKNVDLLFQMARNVLEYDRVSALEVNFKCRSICVEKARELLKVDPYAASEFREIYKKTLLFAARDDFDSYLLYVEWNRDPRKRFYQPRRKVLKQVVDAIQDLVDDKLDLLSISLPPGTGKSTLEIFLLSWMMGKYPDNPNLSSGHSGMLTNSLYEGVLGILKDPEYLWADVFPEITDIITNAKEQTIDLNKKHRFSTLTCRPIGGSLTGATRCEKLLTADDLCSGIEEAMNKERLDKLWTAYTNDLKSRKKLGCKEIHIATRWSVHDVIGRLEKQYCDDPRCKFIVIPALDEDGNSNFDYDHGVGFDNKYFEDMRNNLDDVSWKALFMNQPIEREGLLYAEDELRRYYELPKEFDESKGEFVVKQPDAILGICDTAESGSDYTFLPVAYQYGQDYYIEDCVLFNGGPEKAEPMCASMLVRHRVQMCQFESNSAGWKIADSVQKMVKELGGITHITKKRTLSNKETKVIVNSAFVKEHFLFKDPSLYKRKDTYGQMIEYLTGYTMMGKNKHDDVPDGMAQLALFIQALVGNKVEVMKRFF